RTVNASVRDVRPLSCCGPTLDREVLLKSRRRLAQIDDDIKNRSRSAADQLGLRERWYLVVHPSQRSLSFVERDIALRDFRIQAVGRKFLATKRSSKKTTFVFTLFRLNQESTGQSSLPKNHE